MDSVALTIAVITYAGVALGGIPGLALDRTGIALLGAIGMVVSGELSTRDAVMSIDMPTILLLYGLMVLSSQFRLGGFYTRLAVKITVFMQRPAKVSPCCNDSERGALSGAHERCCLPRLHPCAYRLSYKRGTQPRTIS